MRKNILIYPLILFTFLAQAQTKQIPMQAAHWEVNAKKHHFTQYLGKQSLYINQGRALAKNHHFKNGTLEFDVAFPKKRQFSGVIFRVQKNWLNREEFYLRPHQSGNPDANQYTPIFNGLSGWQLYYGKGHSGPFMYKFDQWMHVKIVMAEQEAEFYIDNMQTPLFRAFELKHVPQSGKLGFISSLGGTYYANLKFTPQTQPVLKGKILKKTPLAEGTITQWRVSNVFKESLIIHQYKLSPAFKATLRWQKQKVEFTGVANLARISKQSRNKKRNTVFARVIINSEKAQVKKMDFGYSDRVRVYCNGQLMYAGNNGFRSRDYRYLGTIGYFDTMYLPLKKGGNEVWLAVSEKLGGWGIQAKLSNRDGIEVQ